MRYLVCRIENNVAKQVTEDCATLESAEYWKRMHESVHPNETYDIVINPNE